MYNIRNQHARKKCKECHKRRTFLNSNEICYVCGITRTIFKPSGNKVIDDFIRHTQTNYVNEIGKMEFVPYKQFKNVEFIAEGGFSKIYKAVWVDGPVKNWGIDSTTYEHNFSRQRNCTVVLKKLNNSKKITTEELNELKIYYQLSLNAKNKKNIIKYFGITQEPITKDIMIIMPYYDSGDLNNYITNNFYNISWINKLNVLLCISSGLIGIHKVGFIHRDLHSGNIFFDNHKYNTTVIGDFGISKSATELSRTNDNNDEIYGIISYIAPEIFQGKEYTTASDIYSFGMIMWEFMTGRKPFWDENHDTELIIKICNGLRPPIVTNAPKGYIELMERCWDSDPNMRPTANSIFNKLWEMRFNEWKSRNQTKIIESSDIGPTINNQGAVYRSRSLSGMIQISSRRQSIDSETDPFYYYWKSTMSTTKRAFEDNLINDNIKRRKLIDEYITKEFDLDININIESR